MYYGIRGPAMSIPNIMCFTIVGANAQPLYPPPPHQNNMYSAALGANAPSPPHTQKEGTHVSYLSRLKRPLATLDLTWCQVRPLQTKAFSTCATPLFYFRDCIPCLSPPPGVIGPCALDACCSTAWLCGGSLHLACYTHCLQPC
jgi:hypothetical protein